MYVKPEIAVLGNATSVILGNKTGQAELMQPVFRQTPSDTELDD